MLNLQNIKEFYPSNLQGFDRFILREYLQFKILEIIYESNFANNLVFMGGTALRIVFNNERFSEDLDFDNINLDESKFDEITKLIVIKLKQQGYEVEIRNVIRGAYHCHIKFPGLLKEIGLSGYVSETLMIRLDTEAQKFDYLPDRFLLNKFDVFTDIFIVPEDIILAQKFYAVINRKRNKGRDFYDIVFLLSRNVKPNYSYLEQKTGLSNPIELKKEILEKVKSLNMSDMATDVKPFLFNPNHDKKVSLFERYISQVDL